MKQSLRSYKIRPMLRREIPRVLQIEKASFEQPYSSAILEQELQIEAARVWVATYRNKIVGYIDFWWVIDEIELVSIAVHPTFKGQGVGTALMQAMLDFATEKKVCFVSLDVRVSNLKAQKLYQHFGFHKVGLRKKYYSDNQEDAYILKKELS